MAIDTTKLDNLQSAYKAAVETWISAIHREEALAGGNHTVAQIDAWESADRDEDQARTIAKTAKRAYEAALRQEFFSF